MADRQPGRAPREPAIGDKRALFAQASALQERCGVQHFLHSRPPGRPLVADDHHLTGLHLTLEDRGHRLLLGFAHPCGTGEFP